MAKTKQTVRKRPGSKERRRTINEEAEGVIDDFGAAAALLTSLTNDLSLGSFEALQPYLRYRNLSLESMCNKIKATVPHIISVSLDASGSDALIAATVGDIALKLRRSRQSTAGSPVANKALPQANFPESQQQEQENATSMPTASRLPPPQV